jgi:hypothetical protein
LEEIEAYASAEIEELRVRIAAREEAIAPLIVELQAFAEQMSAELEREAPYVDEFDWPELPEADEFDDPLFDSRRDYIEQADRYREHKGESEDVTLKRPSRRNDVTLG